MQHAATIVMAATIMVSTIIIVVLTIFFDSGVVSFIFSPMVMTIRIIVGVMVCVLHSACQLLNSRGPKRLTVVVFLSTYSTSTSFKVCAWMLLLGFGYCVQMCSISETYPTFDLFMGLQGDRFGSGCTQDFVLRHPEEFWWSTIAAGTNVASHAPFRSGFCRVYVVAPAHSNSSSGPPF